MNTNWNVGDLCFVYGEGTCLFFITDENINKQLHDYMKVSALEGSRTLGINKNQLYRPRLVAGMWVRHINMDVARCRVEQVGVGKYLLFDQRIIDGVRFADSWTGNSFDWVPCKEPEVVGAAPDEIDQEAAFLAEIAALNKSLNEANSNARFHAAEATKHRMEAERFALENAELQQQVTAALDEIDTLSFQVDAYDLESAGLRDENCGLRSKVYELSQIASKHQAAHYTAEDEAHQLRRDLEVVMSPVPDRPQIVM